MSDDPLRESGVSRRLAEFVVHTRFDELTVPAVEMTKLAILDAIGVSLGASGLDPMCKPFAEQALAVQGRPESTILGFGWKVPAEQAALANGAMAHALDYEDTHEATNMHPNAASIPAALAIAEARGGVDGKTFITAIAVGCEIATRLILAGDPVDGGGRKKGFYPPPLVSTFGATAAVARLLGLDVEQVLDAFSLTLCRSSYSAELIDSPHSHLRAIREGLSAQTAVTSCQLAARGVKGFERPFEGAAGYFHLFGNGRFDAGQLVGNPSRSFQIEATSFKAWPACRGTHVYIQAVLELQQRQRISAEDIASIEVSIGELGKMLVEPAASKRHPVTAIDARFSIPFTVASAIVHGNVGLDSYSREALQNPVVLALAAKVGYRIDPALARPRSEGGGDFIGITLRDGSMRKGGIEHLYGTSRHPIAANRLRDKFIDCAGYANNGVARARLENVMARLLSLENESDVGSILSHLV